MKKVLALVLVLCMVIGLAACGGGSTPANNTPANNTPANNTPASEIAGTYKIRLKQRPSPPSRSRTSTRPTPWALLSKPQ